jgi:DNA-binding NarL/FixJ family response regulator
VEKVIMTPTIRLLIIGEHQGVRNALAKRLRALPQIEVTAAIPRPKTAVPEILPPTPDVVLLSMSNRNDRELDQALDLIRRLVAWGPAVIVLAPIAGELEAKLYREAGAFRCLQQNVNTPELIQVISLAAQSKAALAKGS